jgi:hypothetical protein
VGGEIETDLHMGALRDRLTEIFTEEEAGS